MAYFSFSTSDFAPNERLEAVQHIYGALAQVQLDAPRTQTPHVDAHIRLLPGVSIARVTASSLHAARESGQVTDGNDDVTFLIHPGGQGGWVSHLQAHDSLACTPGRARIVLNHQSGRVDFHGDRVNLLSVAFSRARFMPLINTIDQLPETLLPSGEPLRHLINLALSVTERQDALTAQRSAQMSNQLLELASLAVGATPDARLLAQRGGLREARLRAIKADINAYACTPMSLEEVAVRHAVSPSYIRALFHQDGTSFTDYLLEQRLLRAFSALTSSTMGPRSISDIAFGTGFNNLSWFYRAFNHRFGLTPGDARELASGDDQ